MSTTETKKEKGNIKIFLDTTQIIRLQKESQLSTSL